MSDPFLAAERIAELATSEIEGKMELAAREQLAKLLDLQCKYNDAMNCMNTVSSKFDKWEPIIKESLANMAKACDVTTSVVQFSKKANCGESFFGQIPISKMFNTWEYDSNEREGFMEYAKLPETFCATTIEIWDDLSKKVDDLLTILRRHSEDVRIYPLTRGHNEVWSIYQTVAIGRDLDFKGTVTMEAQTEGVSTEAGLRSGISFPIDNETLVNAAKAAMAIAEEVRALFPSYVALVAKLCDMDGIKNQIRNQLTRKALGSSEKGKEVLALINDIQKSVTTGGTVLLSGNIDINPSLLTMGEEKDE